MIVQYRVWTSTSLYGLMDALMCGDYFQSEGIWASSAAPVVVSDPH